MNNINEKILDSLKLFDLQELYEINKSMGNFFCYIDEFSSSSESSDDDDTSVKYDRENGSEEKIDNIKKSLGWCLWFLNLLSKYRVKYVHPYHLTFQGDHFFISIMLNMDETISFHFRDNMVDILLTNYTMDAFKKRDPEINSKTFDFNQDNFTEILNYINSYLLDVKYCNLPLDISKDEKELFIFYEINYKSLDEFYNFLQKYIIEKFDDLMREKQNKKK